jgi:hypothetical protein
MEMDHIYDLPYQGQHIPHTRKRSLHSYQCVFLSSRIGVVTETAASVPFPCIKDRSSRAGHANLSSERLHHSVLSLDFLAS